MKLRPSIFKNPKGAFFTTYGIEKGEVYIKNSFLGIKYGNRPSVPVSKVTRTYATGTVFGNIVFGEGSHEPVIWENVFRPESKLKLVRETIKNELNQKSDEVQFDTDFDTSIISVENATSSGKTGYGKITSNSKQSTEIVTAVCDFIDNGDGTITDRKNNLMWIKAPWGKSWNGSEFTGEPIRIDWWTATKLFGKGVKVKGWIENGSRMGVLKPEMIEDTDYQYGYKQGNCQVEFAGYNDWRLPTCLEWHKSLCFDENPFDNLKKDVLDLTGLLSTEILEKLITDNLDCWTCNYRDVDDFFTRIGLASDEQIAWKATPSRDTSILDETCNLKYPVMFVRKNR